MSITSTVLTRVDFFLILIFLFYLLTQLELVKGYIVTYHWKSLGLEWPDEVVKDNGIPGPIFVDVLIALRRSSVLCPIASVNKTENERIRCPKPLIAS